MAKPQRAEIVETVEGNRVILTRFKNPIGDQTHCLEVHRTTGNPSTIGVTFVLLTHKELEELHAAFADMVVF